MMIVNLGFLVLLPLFLIVVVTIPSMVFPNGYVRLGRGCVICLVRTAKWVRVKVFFCWKYYDPNVVVRDRKKLMIFAMV